MPLLCIEVENTHTTVGLFRDETLDRRWSLATDGRRTTDEWRLIVSGLLDSGAAPAIDGICVSSTVPAVLRALRPLLADPFGDIASVVLGPGVRTGLPVLVDNPREVGTDRIANALAAIDLVGAPCVVVALGTATTYDVVNPVGQYIGGAIAPGLEVSMAALAQYAAQLRQVELTRPRSVIAKNTVEALQAGGIYGGAGQVDGVVRRIAAELGVPLADLPVLATGMLAPVVLAECDTQLRHEPDLTLHGMRIAFARNA